MNFVYLENVEENHHKTRKKCRATEHLENTKYLYPLFVVSETADAKYLCQDRFTNVGENSNYIRKNIILIFTDQSCSNISHLSFILWNQIQI